MGKKAQIKMVENIGVILVFFVLIVVAIIFYMAFQTGAIDEQASEMKTRNAVELAGKIALLPELQCRKNNVQEEHCFDKFKINAAKLLLLDPHNEDYYFRLLGYSTIKVKSIYPNMLNIEIYNKPKPEFKNNDTFSIPLSIYEPDTDTYNYGVLEVNVYG